MDPYQERYVEHRKRKAQALKMPPNPRVLMGGVQVGRALILARRSVRKFSSNPVSDRTLEYVLQVSLTAAPSSCNRQAMQLIIVRDPVKIAQLDGLLRGGVGWLGKAPIVLLSFADVRAYKSPGEQQFMPWMDAAALLTTLSFVARAEGLASCIVNPSSPSLSTLFDQYYTGHFDVGSRPLFTGAIALGHPAETPEMPKRKAMEEFAKAL